MLNQAIRGTKNLDWANDIEPFDRGIDDNDDSPSLEAHSRVGLWLSLSSMSASQIGKWELLPGKQRMMFWRKTSDFNAAVSA